MANDEADLAAGELPTDAVPVRALREDDLEAIVRIDAAAMGRPRPEYYGAKVRGALGESRLMTSLVAELDGMVVGFLMTTVHYGEFGRTEPTAVLEAIAVHPEHRKRRVGQAMMRQFAMNARAMNVERVRTEVSWNDFELLRFLDAQGFGPSNRLVLELTL